MTIRPRQKRTVQTGGDDRNHLFRTNGHPTRIVVPTKPREPSTSADPASVASWLCSVELKLRPLPKTRTWRGPQVLLQCSATPVKCALTQNGRGVAKLLRAQSESPGSAARPPKLRYVQKSRAFSMGSHPWLCRYSGGQSSRETKSWKIVVTELIGCMVSIYRIGLEEG